MWGTTAHFDYITAQLALKKGAITEDTHSGTRKLCQDDIVVYRTSCNQGYFTYDGIDVCGARAAREIQDEVLKINRYSGSTVDKLSVVGYSLGGLISRFAVGLLYKRDFFVEQGIELMNYTSFCSPHVGVVVLGNRWVARVFNFIGQYAMSTTSRQLFLKDKFEKTGIPLLVYMSEQKGPYFKALSHFKQCSLYANIVNDHRCEWYTAGIDMVDPFTPSRVPQIEGPYIKRYSPVILDISKPLIFESPNSEDGVIINKSELGYGILPSKPGRLASIGSSLVSLVKHIWNYSVAMVKTVVVVPIWFTAFILNAGWQAMFSASRRRNVRKGMTFDEALEGTADNVMDSVYSAILHAQEDEQHNTDKTFESIYSAGHAQLVDVGPYQKRIIKNLNDLPWQRFPVHIHKATHAHAAVIVRYPSVKFTEGYLIVDHFIDSLVM